MAADPTVYLFDGHNLLHAGAWETAAELVDVLAGFVALRGARGVVVFDGSGVDRDVGRLSVRFAPHADTLLERLAAELRDSEEVCLVSSDAAVRGTAGTRVRSMSSTSFVRDLESVQHVEPARGQLRDRLDRATREALERLRRGT